jgi:GH24 family phage-related lysozyme (muramidase)
MELSDNGLKLIQAWEGIEDGNPATANLEPYICPAHVYTVGWGHALKTPTGQNIDTDAFGKAKAAQLASEAMNRLFGAQSITRAQASNLLAQDVAVFAAGVTRRIGERNATQEQFDALVALAFNIGLGNFDVSAVKRLHLAGTRRIGDVSMSALAQASREHAPPINMPIAFVRWSNAKGKWMKGLFRRRLCEALVYGGHDLNVAINTAQSFNG